MSQITSPTLASVMFSDRFRRLDLTGTPDGTVTLAVAVAGEGTVFENTYIADAAGYVTVYDLDRVLEAYIPEVFASITLSVDGSAAIEGGIKVFRSASRVDIPASSFLASRFLTACTGTRHTLAGCRELLTAYVADGETATVTAVYHHASETTGPAGKITSQTFSLGVTAGLNTLDVSPAQFVKPGMQLISYTVQCGRRRAAYMVMAHAPEAGAAFWFRNRFGAPETLYARGIRSTEPAYTRSTANIGGETRVYDITEVVSHKVSTGPLPAAMVPVAMDLASASEVYAMDVRGTSGAALLITDCEMKHTDDPAALNVLSFTYRPASRRTTEIEVQPSVNTFDSTFDDTFA